MNTGTFWRWSLVVAIGTAAAGLWHSASAPADAQATAVARPTAVAVLSLGGVLNQLDEKIVREGELVEDITSRESRVKELLTSVQALSEELKMIEGTDAAPEKAEELVLAQAKLRAEQEVSQAVIENRRKQFEIEFFNKIRTAASAYAEREGFDIVISNDADREVPVQAPSQQVQAIIASTRVLFADGAVDITDEVATFMNNQFRAGGGN
ncbi:MAG: OmpH family outer membrane protein [Planctomycetota bacterium]